MYHIVYLTTNLVNKKFYVGVHSTYNLDDGYLGSGHTLSRAVKKYGKDNFKRDILYFCLDRHEAIYYETIIVDESFIDRIDTYNLQHGGSSKHPHRSEEVIQKFKNSWTLERKQKHSALMSKRYAEGKSTHLLKGGTGGKNNTGKKQTPEHINNRTSKRIGLKHSEETLMKMSIPKPLATCPYCKKTMSQNTCTRYHNENCKLFIAGSHDL